ncbi:MAG TPA: adenylate/guanylate cyclase domain-containing protein [Candidatus Dormibacteraeota bacterium]|nr:adenylate/guanylate cyclase domain-containing protein [Candidatus Dormibacteraeota bacterium]
MTCPACGAENEPRRKYCGECGAALALACPVCGALDTASKFCGECGAALSASGRSVAAPDAATDVASRAAGGPSGSRSPEPVAERRLVTVLFADLVGFTAYAEGRDPEDVRATLTRYFDLASSAIASHGGVIEKFIGDAVMAIWGAPVAHEHDAERAVRAALALLEAAPSLGPELSARAGVMTGEAVVTLGAVGQGMVAGDLVNTASRIQAAAEPGTVLVGEATQRAASRAVAFEPAGELDLKGKAEPVRVWRPLRVVAGVGGRGRADRLEAPFVGRETELRLLKDLFVATGRDRRAHLVSVIGPTGIGKTRLTWELAKHVDGLVEDVWWHEGRCPPYGDGVTFWALGEMVRARCGLTEGDDEATTRGAVAETLLRFVEDEAERRWIEAALLALLGVGSQAAEGEAFFPAWRTFFERMAATATVVLVFEDFHAADGGLLAFTEHLLDWAKSLPIFVVTLSRPDLLEARPGLWSGRRNFTNLHVEPLELTSMRALLDGLVPGLPASVSRAIASRADGIPLYAIETVRMLIDQGRLVSGGDGSFRHASGGRDLGDLAIPETLTELISARLDGLDAADRRLLQDASILGQSFSVAGLEAVSGLDRACLDPRLAVLVRRELLRLETDPGSPERGQYAFVQALIREVAYATLARPERVRGHLAAARYFEALGGDELAGALAGQYLAAYRSTAIGPEADALAVQATRSLRRAAERAVTLGSHEQALRFLTAALELTSDPAEQAELLERAGRAASSGAHHQQAETLLRRAVDLRRASGDRLGLARSASALGWSLLHAWQSIAAIETLGPVAGELLDLAGQPDYVALQAQLARARFMHQDWREAIEMSDAALEAAERRELVPLVADLLVTKGSALGSLGRVVEAIALLRGGLGLALDHDLGSTALRARQNLGGYLRDDDPAAALDLYRDANAANRHLGLADPTLTVIIAGCSVQSGDWDRALTMVDEALEADLEAVDRANLLTPLITIRAFRGQDVSEWTRELDDLIGASSEPDQIASLGGVRADVAFAEGRFADARDEGIAMGRVYDGFIDWGLLEATHACLSSCDLDSVEAILAEHRAAPLHGRAIDLSRALMAAAVAGLEGRTDEAMGLFERVLAGRRGFGHVWEEALTAIDMASVLGPERPEVVAAADRAHAILAQLGARPFLERLERLMSREAVVAGR